MVSLGIQRGALFHGAGRRRGVAMESQSYERRLEFHPSLENSLIDQSALGKDRIDERTGQRLAGLRRVTGTLAQRVEGGKIVFRYCHANIALTVRDGFK